MENDVDKIKKKIDNLDFAQTDLSNSINELNNKIQLLLRNINAFSNYQNKKNIKFKNYEDKNNIDNEIIEEKKISKND